MSLHSEDSTCGDVSLLYDAPLREVADVRINPDTSSNKEENCCDIDEEEAGTMDLLWYLSKKDGQRGSEEPKQGEYKSVVEEEVASADEG